MSDANVGEGILEITADTKPAEQAITGLGNEMNKQAEGLTNFGKKGLLATGVLVAGLGLAGKAASDLNESINAVNVTYGANASGILALSEKASTGLGLSSAAFNGLAVQFSAFAQTIAGESGNVVETIDKLTTRAADFGSVMNIDIPEAARIFQSALAGETEPIRKFGIDLSDAAIKAYGLENGIGGVGREMTAQEKVQARYALLMQATAKTAGDFANTSDGAANAQRIMTAELTNMAASIGAQVLPPLTSLVSGVTGAVKWIGKMNEETGGAIGKFAIFGTAGIGLISVVARISGSVLKLVDKFTTLGEDGSRSISKAGKAAAVAGGLIGAATIVYGLYASDKAEATRVTDEFVDALNAESEGQAGALDALLARQLAESGALELGRALGLNATDMARVIKGEQVPAWEALTDATHEFGSDAAQLAIRLGPLEDGLARAKQQIADTAEATAALGATSTYVGEIFVDKVTPGVDTSAKAWIGYGKSLDDAAKQEARTKSATEASTRALEYAQQANEDARDAIIRHVEALNNQIDTMRSAADATYAVRSATDDYTDFLQGLDTAVKDAKGDQEALNRIYREGTTSATEVADATVRVYDETLKASGQTISATQKLDLWNTSMLEAAKQASGPLRQSIIDYVAQVNGIPSEKVSDISALIDTYSVGATKLALDTVSEARDVAIRADADTASLNKVGVIFDTLTRPRFVKINGEYVGARFAAGTPSAPPGTALVGEDGPELVRFRGGEQVYSASVSASMMRTTATPIAPAIGWSMPDEVTWVIEGQPFTGRLVAHDREQLERHKAGLRG